MTDIIAYIIIASALIAAAYMLIDHIRHPRTCTTDCDGCELRSTCEKPSK